MSLNADDEILQDFLVEASEIVEQLGEQLVDLEQRPDDADLLNAIFRGFHTVKGGAGFLAITPLVDTCHYSEDVFNVLRQGQRSVTPQLMDSILQALDVVNDMMDMIRDGEMPEPADPALLASLEALAQPAGDDSGSEPEAVAEGAAEEAAVAEPEPVEAEPVAAETAEPEATAPGGDDITEDEFENLLDELHGKGKFTGKPDGAAAADAPAAESAGDEISEDEFEALLDDLHGKGKHGGVPSQKGAAGKSQPAGDEITEDEFEALLDDLHG